MVKIFKNILVRRGNQTSHLYLFNDSGKVVSRDKVDTVTGVPHPGIIIGQDIWKRIWVIHNHYKNGKPHIVLLSEYADGERVIYDSRQVCFTQEQIVERAIYYWNERDTYSWLKYNCQHFVNLIVRGETVSETVDKFSDITTLTGSAVSLFGLLTGNEKAAKVGAVIALTGLGAKAASRKWR